MDKKHKPFLLLGILVALIVLVAGIYCITRPDPVAGNKTITVDVVHQDGSSKSFTYTTPAEYLGEVLLEEKLIQGEQGPYGFYITEVDGEQAIFESDGAYWALYQGGDYATTGVDQTPIADGSAFSLVYTIG